MERYVIDTNIVIRYLLNDHQDLYRKARDFFDLVKLGRARAILEQTVFTEAVFVLSKTYQIPRQQIAKALRNLFMYKGIMNTDKDTLIKALDLYSSSNLHIVDCIIASKAAQENCKVMTFDEELAKVSKDLVPIPLKQEHE